MRFKPGATHLIFFDIEYYVPPEYRDRPGLKANPYDSGGFVIGGVFQRYFPLDKSNNWEPKKEFWIWDQEGGSIEEREKKLLEKVYFYIRESWTRWEVLGQVLDKNPNLTEPIAVGFGISRFDIPVLFVRSLKHEIADPAKLYETYFKLRQFDLSIAASPLIPERKYHRILGPVSQNWTVKNLLKEEDRKPSGTTVWELYDSGDYEKIKNRTWREVEATKEVYLKVLKLRNETSKVILD
ncbi:hypothetical protein A3L11_02685 [Thermococcus siculi]|uniref:Uncharacterized protein n=1 Tax=Thermococcus siculi TaxID=72803 RepID=A0A2Z2MIH6_9EURY|nr:hypothetical protein [Thermococcus siculi]ASJ08189.1 hypothetical protein A3L11_02685 [Thermococcus siculi]